MEKRRFVDNPVLPIRLDRGLYARFKMLVAASRRANYKHMAGPKNIVARGVASLESDLKEHCLRTGQDFRVIIEGNAAKITQNEAPIGNVDNGDGI